MGITSQVAGQSLFALPQWYAVRTRSNFEKTIAAELILKGVESYLPATREVHKWTQRKKIVDVPLFPGYVFARFVDTPEDRVRVLRTQGAVRILGSGMQIEPVSGLELDSIRRLLESAVPFVRHPFLREGSWVRVKRGPLADLEGLFVRAKGPGRLLLSVTMLSQSVATEIDACDVEVIRPPAGHICR